MENKKSKNLVVISGVLHGHFTGSVEIVRELVSFGYNVTCYVLDQFADRMKNVGAKIVVLNIDRSDFKTLVPPDAPPYAVNSFIVGRAIDGILTLLPKDETKYDYYLFDSFLDVLEMNKILKIPTEKISLIYSAFLFSDEDQINPLRVSGLKAVNEKYNINLGDFILIHYVPNKFKKLLLTSKLFHLRGEQVDDTCYFIGPNVEKREIDQNFKFKKDKNKKLIYISLGTIFHFQDKFYETCIEAFRDSKEYQVIISVGQFTDINAFKDLPKNISIYNYVPQTQLLPDVDIFITHCGLNSISEGLLAGCQIIAIPQRYDQFDNSRRIEQLEAGIFLDKNKIKITVDVLKNAVNELRINKEKYKKGLDKIVESFKEVIDNRKNVYEKIFV